MTPPYQHISLYLSIVILSVTACLTLWPIVLDFRTYHKKKQHVHGIHSGWLSVITIFLDFVLLGLYISGLIFEILMMLSGTLRYAWLELAFLCALQLQVSTNVRPPPIYVSIYQLYSQIIRFFSILELSRSKAGGFFVVFGLAITAEILVFHNREDHRWYETLHL
jgi:hypothetical protein